MSQNLAPRSAITRAACVALALSTTACSTVTTGPTPASPPVSWSTLPAVIDGPGGEAWMTRHPDGKLIVFGRHDEKWQNHRLYMTRLVGSQWTDPVRLPFTQDVDGSAPHFAPDGRSMLFVSSRSPTGEERSGEAREPNIWRVNWDGANWGEPRQLPAPINSPANEIDAVEVNGGVIYFSSMRPGGNGRLPDLYRAVPTAAGYQVAPLAPFNTERTESTLYVTPDESLIIFHRADDPAGLGKDDLFAARRTASGWGAAVHLGGAANSAEFDYGPELSRDGSTLYFTTHRSGQAGIMAVNLAEAMGR